MQPVLKFINQENKREWT